MKRMRRAGMILSVVCLLCSTYGNHALAVEQTGIMAEQTQPEEAKITEGTDESGENTESEQDGDKDSEGAGEKEEDAGDALANPDKEGSDSEEKKKEDTELPTDEESGGKENSSEETHETGEDDSENESGEEEIQDESKEGMTDRKEDASAEEIEEEKAEETEAVLLSMAKIGEVSRVDWLSELVTIFEISVAEDNYPDNYFSDIDASYTGYRTIMLATEFGLVDVEAGEAFCPDDAADREFAAHTLNYCLGFAPSEENKYTYAESGEVTYADDIQVAVERGWLSLINGSFLPKEAVTAAEKTAMLNDAKTVMASRKQTQTHSGNYTFAADVTDLTGAGVEAELTDVDVLTFHVCDVELTEGKKYGLELSGFPTVFKAIHMKDEDKNTVIQFESVPLDEAFTDIDMQGSMDVDLAMVQAYNDDIELQYIVGGTEEEQWEDGTKYETLEEVGNQEISAVEATMTYALDDFSGSIGLAPGVKATVSCKVSDVKPDYDVNLMAGRAHVAVNAKVNFSCTVSADVMEAAGISPTLELVRIPIACIGYFDVKLNMTISGEATLNLADNVYLALYYDKGDFRMEKNFSKDSFTLQTHIEISAGLTATLGMSACNIMKGELFAKFGAKNVLDSMTYGDGKTPATCAHHTAWLFASAGGFADVKLLSQSKSWGKTYQIYTEKNSPIRVSFHYEDGIAVPRCTRGTAYGPSGRKWGYYTSADSRYGYNGASQGIGANGEPYTIFEYTLDDANRATITKYQGNVSALSIPKTLDGHTVVGIGSYVFQNNTMLRVVVVPDSVTEIGSYAFGGCVNLSQVTLSRNLISMGGGVGRFIGVKVWGQ